MERALDERRLGTPLGSQLAGRTALLVGFGAIGRQLAPRLHAFGVRVLAVRRGPWSHEDRSPPAPRTRAAPAPLRTSAARPRAASFRRCTLSRRKPR